MISLRKLERVWNQELVHEWPLLKRGTPQLITYKELAYTSDFIADIAYSWNISSLNRTARRPRYNTADDLASAPASDPDLYPDLAFTPS